MDLFPININESEQILKIKVFFGKYNFFLENIYNLLLGKKRINQQIVFEKIHFMLSK
jgi:hypothetical protein